MICTRHLPSATVQRSKPLSTCVSTSLLRLHGERHRPRLRNRTGSACDGYVVESWSGAGVPSTATSANVTGPTTTR